MKISTLQKKQDEIELFLVANEIKSNERHNDFFGGHYYILKYFIIAVRLD